MNTTLARTLVTLALIGFGGAAGNAAAHDRDNERGAREKHRHEHRSARHHDHFDHKRLHARHDVRRHRGHGSERVTIIFRSIFR